MLDYHLHLWAHGQPDRAVTVEELAAYCERAARAGVEEIAITEHLFRFGQADAVLGGWWEDDPDPRQAAATGAYWEEHARGDLDSYVEAVLAAKADGLPIVLGLEVDYYRDRMAEVSGLLAGYPFDVLLGSVHWLGAWRFDVLDEQTTVAEWARRGVERAWAAYTEALEELAASGACDVLAHPDLVKVAGHRPAVPDEFYDRMAEAAASSGMVAEVSSAGWRKPIAQAYPAPALLARLRARGVAITTASDAHGLADVADRATQLHRLVTGTGYDALCAWRARRPVSVPVGPEPAVLVGPEPLAAAAGQPSDAAAPGGAAGPGQ